MCEVGTDKCTYPNCPEACTGRDAVKDLAVCDAAKDSFIENDTLPGWIKMAMPSKIYMLIETSLDAIPYWIHRSQKAEADRDGLKRELEQGSKALELAREDAAVMRDSVQNRRDGANIGRGGFHR